MKTNIEKVIDFLWLSRNEYDQRIKNGQKIFFDAPLYGGLPKCMAEKLTPEEIKAIQSVWKTLVSWSSHEELYSPFENKSEFANAIRYSLGKKLSNEDSDEEEKDEPYEVTLGDFLEWAVKNKWWLRGFENIDRSTEGPQAKEGWIFVHTTHMGFVTDEQIRKEVPHKTEEEWRRWGR